MRLRQLALAMALTLLGACNMAISDRPMLSGEQRSSIRLKDGIWLADDPKCKFDAAAPANEWPKCAQWFLMRNDKVVGASGSKADAKPDDQIELLIAKGSPTLVQIPLKDEDDGTISYAFAVLEAPNNSDQLTDIRTWIVACGIEHHGSRFPDNIQHFRGMDKKCRPESLAALRAAAVASRPKVSKRLRWRWVGPNTQ